MALKAGIVGLPNVGKSTLFNAITKSNVPAVNYPFATIEPNVGVVELHDERIDKLVEMVSPQKTIKATVEYTDIAGLVEGASKGEGLGNKFLANIREVDAIVHVVRCFDDDNITHVAGSVDPIRDMKIINLELMLADMETLTKVINRTKKKGDNKRATEMQFEFDLATKLLTSLENEISTRKLDLTDEEIFQAKQYNLLTLKPVIYVCNVSESNASTPENEEHFKAFQIAAEEDGAKVIGISAQIEREIAGLDEDEQEIFFAELGITSSGLTRLTKATFELLNLSTYFTVGKVEVRAWTFTNGISAPQGAGIIHTDFERGFIKAEVIAYDDFVKYNGEQGAKEAGKARFEGKTYILKDGDIVHFRFNV